jgi:hypothetical protein
MVFHLFSNPLNAEERASLPEIQTACSHWDWAFRRFVRKKESETAGNQRLGVSRVEPR